MKAIFYWREIAVICSFNKAIIDNLKLLIVAQIISFLAKEVSCLNSDVYFFFREV